MKAKKSFSVFIVLLAVLIVIADNSFCQWILQNPLPTGVPNAQLTGISFENPSTGYLNDNTRTLYKTTNCGYNWFLLPITIGNVYSFCIIAPGNIIAAGVSGHILKSTDGGNNWTNYITGLTEVSNPQFYDINTGWIAGRGATGTTPCILRTTDSGNNWTIHNFGISNHVISSFNFLNQNTGFLTVNYYVPSPPYPTFIVIVYMTGSSGMNWSQIYYQGGNQNNSFYDITFLDVNTGYVINNYFSIYKSTNSGMNWNGLNSLSFQDIEFINTSTGWAGTGTTGLGRIYKTTNGASNWSIQLEITSPIYKVNFSDSLNGWAVGGAGSIFKTTNSGVKWINRATGFNNNVTSIKFLTDSTGLAVGYSGLIAKTTNGGNIWFEKTSGTEEHLLSLSFVNSLSGWVAGRNGIILKSTNGGENWIQQTSGTTNHLNAMFFINAYTGWAAGHAGTVIKTTNGGLNWFASNISTNDSLFGIQFFNANTGVAIAKNKFLFKTTNGGTNWANFSVSTITDFYTVYFINQNSGWAAGPNGVCRTTNGGLNWTGNYIVNNIRSIYFFDARYGIAAGNTYWRTIDSGNTWVSYPALGASINTMHFINGNTGWLAGNNGYIYKSTNAGLTYLLKTSNEIPSSFSLNQNYPNPFNSETKIRFSIHKTEHWKLRTPSRESWKTNSEGTCLVRLKFYDITGRDIETLVNEMLPPGTYEVTFNGKGHNSGVYFYRLQAGDNSETKRLLLIK